MSRSDGVCGLHANSAPHRPCGGDDGEDEAEGGAVSEGGGLEAGVPDGERQHPGEHGAEGSVRCETDGDAERNAQDGDLDADEQRPEDEPRSGEAQRHADADLSALCFDHTARKVEGAERGAGQDQPSEHVPELLVAVDVVIQHAVRVLVAWLHHAHGQSRVGEGCGDGPPGLVRVDAGAEAEEQVIHTPGTVGESLGGAEGREDGTEVGFGEEPAFLGDDEEVLRACALAYVANIAAADVDSAGGGQAVVRREVPFKHHRRLVGVTPVEGSPRPCSTHTRLRRGRPLRRSTPMMRPGTRMVLPLVDASSCVGTTRRSSARRSDPAGTRPSAASIRGGCINAVCCLDPQVVHAERGEAGVVGRAAT